MHDRDGRDRSRTIEKPYRDDLPLMQVSREPVAYVCVLRLIGAPYACSSSVWRIGRRESRSRRRARQGASAIVDRAETAIGQNCKLLGMSYAFRGVIPQIRSCQKPTTS